MSVYPTAFPPDVQMSTIWRTVSPQAHLNHATSNGSKADLTSHLWSWSGSPSTKPQCQNCEYLMGHFMGHLENTFGSALALKQLSFMCARDARERVPSNAEKLSWISSVRIADCDSYCVQSTVRSHIIRFPGKEKTAGSCSCLLGPRPAPVLLDIGGCSSSLGKHAVSNGRLAVTGSKLRTRTPWRCLRGAWYGHTSPIKLL